MFQNYSMKNGLLSNFTTDVVQDREGFIWASCANGVIRYSGSSFTYFQQQSTNLDYRLISNHVLDLFSEPGGDIWINTNIGLCKYDIEKDKIINFKQKSIGWGRVFVKHKKVFISQYKGVEEYLLENDSLIFKHYYENTKNNSIYNIIKHGQSIWATAEDNPSLFEIKNNESKLKKIIYDNELLTINSICEFDKENILLGTQNSGVFIYNTFNENLNLLTKKNLINITCIVKYSFNSENLILIGTKNHGLFVYNLNKNTELINIESEFGKPQGLSSNQIENILIDKHDGIWVACDKGISYFHPSLQKTKIHFLGNNGFENISINTVTPIENNVFLIGTENIGLILYNNLNKAKKVISSKNLSINKICKVNEDIYLIATKIGSYEFSYKTMKLRKVIMKNLNNMPILNIVKLSDTLYGFCMQNGACIFNYYTKKITFKEPFLLNTKQEKKYCKDLLLVGNQLWILRFFNGIDIYNFQTKKLSTVTPNVIVKKPIDFFNFCIKDDFVYVSSTFGIIKINIQKPSLYQLINSNNGVDGDNVQNIIYSKMQQSLFYSNMSGVYKYNEIKQKSELVFSYENYPQKWFNQFTILNNNDFLSTVSDHFIIHKQLFPFKNLSVPSNEIESILINNQPIELKSETIKLKFNQNNILVKLKAICYPDVDKNKWYYCYSSDENLWYQTTNGEINLYNLIPGEYDILLYSENNEGKKSMVKKILKISISQPFYNTWWFICLILLCFISFFLMFYFYKKRQTQKFQKIRNQISRDLHDELGANVSAINIMSQLLNKNIDSRNNQEITSKISKYSIEVSDTINDIIWNINPKFDTTDELIKKMMYCATNMIESAGILLNIELPDTIDEIKIASHIKYNLYLIFKELVNNVAKHSKAKECKIRFLLNKNFFEFEIRDNGVGFNPNLETSRNGISNIKERSKSIEAILDIETEINKGVKTNLKYKLK